MKRGRQTEKERDSTVSDTTKEKEEIETNTAKKTESEEGER